MVLHFIQAWSTPILARCGLFDLYQPDLDVIEDGGQRLHQLMGGMPHDGPSNGRPLGGEQVKQVHGAFTTTEKPNAGGAAPLAS